jgi:hypothetical protein
MFVPQLHIRQGNFLLFVYHWHFIILLKYLYTFLIIPFFSQIQAISLSFYITKKNYLMNIPASIGTAVNTVYWETDWLTN